MSKINNQNCTIKSLSPVAIRNLFLQNTRKTLYGFPKYSRYIYTHKINGLAKPV